MRPRTTSLQRAFLLLVALLLTGLGATAQAACAFRAAAAGITFSPALDPSTGLVRTAYTDVIVRCRAPGPSIPSSWGFAGLYGANPNLRLKHSTLSDFIAYSIGNPPPQVSGGGRTRTFRVTATIQPASYLNAYAGTYSDSLTITVLP